ncbi:hypothetical protein [Pseudomonas fragi]|uniref:hypothetical protein n=1 Tax=Pseudomonas fragi TaxID=296 RepID=UPI001594F7AF|nr:hypothetical protein [Pseudomonas fragi]
MAVRAVLPALHTHTLPLVQCLYRLATALVQAHLQVVAQHKKARTDGLLAQVIGQPIGSARQLGWAAVESQQEQSIIHRIAVAFLLAKQLNFAADLRKQCGLAQLLIQITLVKFAAWLGPGNIKRIVGDGELAGLLAQAVHAVYVIAKRRVLIAALLGSVVIAQQTQPHALAHRVDDIEVDGFQAKTLFECTFIQRLADQQGMAECQDFGPRGDIEQRRAGQLLGPGVAIQGCRGIGRRDDPQTHQPDREKKSNAQGSISL